MKERETEKQRKREQRGREKEIREGKRTREK